VHGEAGAAHSLRAEAALLVRVGVRVRVGVAVGVGTGVGVGVGVRDGVRRKRPRSFSLRNSLHLPISPYISLYLRSFSLRNSQPSCTTFHPQWMGVTCVRVRVRLRVWG